MYSNVRVSKSKERCVAALLQEVKPKVFFAVKLYSAGKEGRMEFDVYVKHRLDGTNASKVIVIAIVEEFETVTVKLEDSTEIVK